MKAIRVDGEVISGIGDHYDLLLADTMQLRMWDEEDVDALLSTNRIEFGQYFVDGYADGKPVWKFSTDETRNSAYSSLHMVEQCRIVGRKK